jgi:hypothetical protein
MTTPIFLGTCVLSLAAFFCGQSSPGYFVNDGTGGPLPPVPDTYPDLECQANGFCADGGPGCIQRGWDVNGIEKPKGSPWVLNDKGDCVDVVT